MPLMQEVYCPKDDGVLKLIQDVVRQGTYNKNHEECQTCCNRRECAEAVAGSMARGHCQTA